MLRIKPATAAAAGFILWVAGHVWGALHGFTDVANDPTGWVFYRHVYAPANILAKIGFYVFLLAALFGTIRWVYTAVHTAAKSSTH